MQAKIANMNVVEDMAFMSPSDTNPALTGYALLSPGFGVDFVTYNGAFTADGSVPTFNENHQGLVSINIATYYAYFNKDDTKYLLIHEGTKAVTQIDLFPGATPKGNTMVRGTQMLMVASMAGAQSKLQAFNITDLIPCHASCNTCAGLPSANGCTSCSPPNFFNEGSCGTTCPSNKYKDLVTNECGPCDPSCATCFSGAINGCLTCIPTRIDNGGGDCSKGCPAGKYLDVPTKTCFPCDASCKTCETNATKCTACPQPLFLSGNTCLVKCPDGQFGDPVT